MSPGVTAIIPCLGEGRAVGDLIEAVRQQVIDPGKLRIVLADRHGPETYSRRLLRSLAREPDVSLVEVSGPSATLAVVRNAGVAAAQALGSDAVFFLEPGYRMVPGYLDRACARLAAMPELAFVTSWLRRDVLGSGGSELVAPRSCRVEELLAMGEGFHPATVLRVSLWESLAGFDESLEALDDFEFWLRAVGGGAAGEVLPEALVVHEPLTSPRYRMELERHLRGPALFAVFERHQQLFEQHLPVVLTARERELLDLAALWRPLEQKRSALSDQLAALHREIEKLIGTLKQHGSDRVDLGDLRRTTPISPEWGIDRGKPVDRHYIEAFLAAHAEDIRGWVLEVQEADYTRRFGGERVVHSDVLDINAGNRHATVFADLREASGIPSETYDCIILTQTLHIIDDVRAALAEAARLLRPGGVLLLTFPCLSRVCLEYGPDADFWRLTEAGARHLLAEVFPPDHLEVKGFGNVLVSSAFLQGLAEDELRPEEYDHYDPYNPTLIGARAVKPAERASQVTAGSPAIRAGHDQPGPAVVLAYHRVAAPGQDIHGLCIPPGEFRRQMEELRRRWTPMPLTELVAAAQACDLPPGAVAVTFDDGYIDALHEVSPVLLDLGIPATFFIVTEHLQCPQEFWWDRLERVLLGPQAVPPVLELRLPPGRLEISTGSGAEREAAHSQLYPIVLAAPPAQRDEIIRQLIRWGGADPAVRLDHRPMTGVEVRELASRPGHTVGAHGVYHLALSKHPPETVQREVMEARSCLQRLLGQPVDAFAYPYGDVTDEAVDMVRATGYRLAVTCEELRIERRVDPFRIPRLARMPRD